MRENWTRLVTVKAQKCERIYLKHSVRLLTDHIHGRKKEKNQVHVQKCHLSKHMDRDSWKRQSFKNLNMVF